jgi:hypothetical protein
MHIHRRTGTGAGLLISLVCLLAPGMAQAAKTYTVRVEGQSQTLLAKKTVVVPDSGAIAGADSSCTYDEPAGPLEIGTGGNWDRGASPPSSYAGLVETILGETHTGSTSWFLWVNGKWGGGICYQHIQAGDDVLVMAGAFDADYNAVDLPLYVSGAPAQVSKGSAFTVTVQEPHPDKGAYNDFQTGTGTLQPAVGATVVVGSASATVGSDGKATLTATETGQLTLQAKRGTASSRSETYPVCVSNGNDGTCGTTAPAPAAPAVVAPPVVDRTPPAASIKAVTEGRTYARGKGPRELAGSAVDASGLLTVKLRITRTVGGRCWSFSPTKLGFVGMRCGAAHGSWFAIGSSPAWSYLLPSRLPRGRYVVDVNAIDKKYNRDDTRRRGSNRVVFEVS